MIYLTILSVLLRERELCSNYIDDVETNYNTREARQVRCQIFFSSQIFFANFFNLKGELRCQRTLLDLKKGQKIRAFPILVFCVDPPFKRKKPIKWWNLKMLYSLLVDVQGKGT